MNSHLLYKVAKYIIYAIVLFGLFRYVPDQPMNTRDIAIIIIIVLLINLILEYLCDNLLGKRANTSNSAKPRQRCYCENVEGFGTANNQDLTVKAGDNATPATKTNGGTSQTALQGSGSSGANPQGSVKTPGTGSNGSSQGSAKMASNGSTGTNGNGQATKSGSCPSALNPAPESNTSQQSTGISQPAQPRKKGPLYRTPEDEYAYEYAIEPEDEDELDTEDMPPVDVLPNSTRAKWLKFEKERRKQPPVVNSNIVQNEMKYSIYRVADKPLGDNDAYKDYEYGYSFMPPSNWYPPPERPPVCVTENRCPVCPSLTIGAPADLKEFDTSRRITPPDTISDAYREEKLNSGR
jgi:hypothetical protein